MIIDANIYWLPDELFSQPEILSAFLRCVPRAYDVHAFAERTDSGDVAIRIEKPLGCENLNYLQSDYVMEKQLAHMDAAGVDKAVMKLPGCQEWLSVEFCHTIGLDYVSCSPFRIPIARLAAAQAAIKEM